MTWKRFTSLSCVLLPGGETFRSGWSPHSTLEKLRIEWRPTDQAYTDSPHTRHVTLYPSNCRGASRPKALRNALLRLALTLASFTAPLITNCCHRAILLPDLPYFNPIRSLLSPIPLACLPPDPITSLPSGFPSQVSFSHSLCALITGFCLFFSFIHWIILPSTLGLPCEMAIYSVKGIRIVKSCGDYSKWIFLLSMGGGKWE